jgi:hypothetical protein
LPVTQLDDKWTWRYKDPPPGIRLYLPPCVDNVRGVFVCYVFHDSDPRELARLWQFALVAVPTEFEYDIGYHDKRNPRAKLGHPVGNTGILLRYLDEAAKATKHPELAVAPLVGWVGQNGSFVGADLLTRAPDRVIAWADSFPHTLARFPELTAKVPFALAWEANGNDLKERAAGREKAGNLTGKPTPPPDLACRASTYGFPHGIYSKYQFFAAYLDRCIKLRLPADPPPPGQVTKLRPVAVADGWAGDFNPVGEWSPIAPTKEARGMVSPGWLPDEYMAWAWRSYHSANPPLKLTAPAVEFQKIKGKWGGPECGLGYGAPVKAGAALTFSAESVADFESVEFRDGDRLVGTAKQSPWKAEGVKLERGLHVLFAVGVKKDGTRAASRPAFLVVE